MGKVSVKEIKDVIKSIDNKPIEFTFGEPDNTITVEFKPYLSLTDEILFVQRVINGIFISNEYHVEYKNIVFTSVLLDMFSNLPLPYSGTNEDKAPNLSVLKDWDNVFHFKDTIYTYYTSFGNVSEENPIGDQNRFAFYVDYLENLVNDKIDYINKQNLKKSKLDDLFDTITSTVQKFDTQFDGVDIKGALNKLASLKDVDEDNVIKAIVDTLPKNIADTFPKSEDNITNIRDIKQ